MKKKIFGIIAVIIVLSAIFAFSAQAEEPWICGYQQMNRMFFETLLAPIGNILALIEKIFFWL